MKINLFTNTSSTPFVSSKDIAGLQILFESLLGRSFNKWINDFNRMEGEKS